MGGTQMSSVSSGRNQKLPPATPLRRPDAPGRWRVTLANGQSFKCRVVDRNGELYAIRGICFAVAVPVDHLVGDWLLLD